MATFMADIEGAGQPDYSSRVNPTHKVGTRIPTDDGRVFRYVKAGAVDLVAGNVVQSPAIVALHLANTPPAVAVGATSFVYTPGATAGAADLYADGLMQVDTTPGNGYTYGVSTHGAITASTAFTLFLKDAIQVALTTSSRVGLIANKFNGVVQLPVTTATGVIVGVAPAVISANQYGWVQTWGLCSVLVAGTPALGAIVMGPGATAGAAEIIVAAGTLIVAQIVGQMAQVGVAGKNNFIDIRINP